MSDKKALIQAALFVSENPLTLNKLSKITGLTSKSTVKEILEEIREDFGKISSSIHLTLTPEGYQFQVKDEFLDKVSHLTPFSDLTSGQLRALGLIALQQPLKQSEIVKIQGNKAYNYIKRLEKKKLITAEKHGRTKLVKTTKEFERYFGNRLEDIQNKISTGIDIADSKQEIKVKEEN